MNSRQASMINDLIIFGFSINEIVIHDQESVHLLDSLIDSVTVITTFKNDDVTFNIDKEGQVKSGSAEEITEFLAVGQNNSTYD
ncbi:MAG: hypothetical protein GY820_38190 [Gammaproteobacteria bacterium]|nr:hypothetical protein [Gammaproteobacteria bacterium]